MFRGALPGLSSWNQEEGRGRERALGMPQLLEKFSLHMVKYNVWGFKR